MSGFVYAIESGDVVKIGWSGNPERRFIKIAADCSRPCRLLGYIEGSRDDEAGIHVKFSNLRQHGEWFSASNELLQFVAHWPLPLRERKRRREYTPLIHGSASVADIIGLWPTISEFSRDIGLKRESHGTLMKYRGSIPVAHWQKVVDAAKARGIDLSYEDLALAHAQPSSPASEVVEAAE